MSKMKLNTVRFLCIINPQIQKRSYYHNMRIYNSPAKIQNDLCDFVHLVKSNTAFK